MEVLDKVEKIGGDYTFVGVIVSKFKKLSGATRFVVEDDRGVLHVYSEKNLKAVVVKVAVEPVSVRNCNRHLDCDAADARAAEAGKRNEWGMPITRTDHCHDDCCEDCFGN